VSLVRELRRRKVVRVALVYGATAFAVVQAADLVYRALAVPTWALTVTVTLVILGFPLALVLAWAFEVTPEGVRRAGGPGPPGDPADGSAAPGMRQSWVGGLTLTVVAALGLLGVGLGAGWFLGGGSGEDPGEEAGARTTPGAATAGGGATAGTAPTEASVAALPFANLSPDEDDRYFADGVHEEILTRLARVGSLKVISRTSVMGYRGTDLNLRDIGLELGVRYVLEGSVRRVGDRVRVSAQLIDAGSDAHLWAETYDRSVSDVLAIQSEVATRIAEALRSELSPEERHRIEERPTESEAAYDLYLRASSLTWRAMGTDPSLGERYWKGAVELLERAVELDPAFALAWAELAEAHVELYWFGHDRREERRARAERAAARAVELAPESGEAHFASGLVAYHGRRDYEKALEEARLAGRSLPGDLDVVALTGWVQRRLGRYGEAYRMLRRAYELDPRNPSWTGELASTTLLAGGSFEEALAWLERARQLDPTSFAFHIQTARLHLEERGDLPAAREILSPIDLATRRDEPALLDIRFRLALLARDYGGALGVLEGVDAPVLIMQGNTVAVDYLRGLALHLAGRTEEARAAFRRALPAMEARDLAEPDYYGVLRNLALVHAALGDGERAHRFMDRALALLPVDKDRFVGPVQLEVKAAMHRWLGEREEALAALERLSSLEYSRGQVSPHLLRLDPFWDPLRDDPRFRALIQDAPEPAAPAARRKTAADGSHGR